MKVLTILPAEYESNSYAVSQDGKNCVLIDCGNARVLEKCSDAGLAVKAVLLTHGHLDHVAGCSELQRKGAEIYCGADEENFIFSEENKSIFGVNPPAFKIDGTLKDGEEINLCGLTVKVIATPGHTAGGVCYLIENYLFTGDTLFSGSVGRFDFPTGDGGQLIKSVKKLYGLNGDYTVYCGHGESTTLQRERVSNAFVKA